MTVREQLDQWFDQHWEEQLRDLQHMVRIPSVARYDDPQTPYGPECLNVLQEMLRIGGAYGFRTENIADRVGSLSMGSASPENEIGIWCHLDVVPAGAGWQHTSPFVPKQVDDYLIGRGADDNKGPAIGVMYVLRALKELNIQTRHNMKLFVGTDEEHGMQDVQYFSRHFPADKLSIIADCGFPVCYGEKGIITFDFISKNRMETVTGVRAGVASNIIPAEAEMTIAGNRLEGHGTQGHSAFPEGSVNAIRDLLTCAVQSGDLSDNDRKTIAFFAGIQDDWGQALGMAGEDEISGRTSAVPVMMFLTDEGRLALRINARTCISCDHQAVLQVLRELAEENNCTLENIETKPSSYFPKENPVVQALTEACNETTGLDLQPYVMAGGTYCKYLQKAIGYGFGGLPRPKSDLFAQGHGGAHQPDEGLYLPNYRKAMTVFAMGLLAADQVL